MKNYFLMGIIYNATQKKPITVDKFGDFRECNDGERTFKKHRTENNELHVRYPYIPKSIILFDSYRLRNGKLFSPRC